MKEKELPKLKCSVCGAPTTLCFLTPKGEVIMCFQHAAEWLTKQKKETTND